MLIIGTLKENRAFSLIEIMLVVIIIGIVISFAAPNFSKGYARFQFNKTTEDLLALSRWAQAMAIGQEREYALSFALDRRSYGLVREELNQDRAAKVNFEPIQGKLGAMHTIPDGIQLETQENLIEFYPDGTINSAVIELNSPEQKTTLSSSLMRGMMTKVDQ